MKLKKSTATKGKEAPPTEFIPSADDSSADHDSNFREAMKKELAPTKLKKFADYIDNEYAQALEACYGFNPVKGFLIEPAKLSGFYNQFRTDFPIAHLVFATIASSRSFSALTTKSAEYAPTNPTTESASTNPTHGVATVNETNTPTIPTAGAATVIEPITPSNPTTGAATTSQSNSDDLVGTNSASLEIEQDLHRKERMMLFLFFGLIRTKSRYLLKHWAMVEPFGHYFKGHQQPGRNSLSGAFTSTLETCWKRQNEIYERFLPSFNEELQSESTNYGSYDNYNEVLPKKNPTDGKNAITHIGTVYYAKKAKPIDLPVGTIVKSPHGVMFEVDSCKQETPYRFMVCGTIVSHLESTVDKVVADKNLILTGVVWPEVGWEVQSMPGFTERPPVTYTKQRIQPPRRAWVEEGASDTDILFSRKRKWSEPGASNGVSFSTNRMHNVTIMS